MKIFILAELFGSFAYVRTWSRTYAEYQNKNFAQQLSPVGNSYRATSRSHNRTPDESGGGCHLEAGGDIECECTVALLSFTFVQPDKA